MAGLNLKERKKKRMEERLKICGPRNKRGYNPFGNLVELDKYDKMILQGEIVNIPLQRWIIKAKHNVLHRAAKMVKNQHRRNSMNLLRTIKLN
jgi:hypothetical protein